MLFQVLGPLEARTPAGSDLAIRPGKPTTVMTALLLDRGKWVSVDRLIDVTWEGRPPPASAWGNLKSYICGLRTALSPVANRVRIESRQGAYRIVVDRGEVDVDVVEHDAVQARSALRRGEAERASELLTRALNLWRGTPFEGMPCSAAVTEVTRLERLRTRMREDLAESWRVLGRDLDALVQLHSLLDEDPLREHIWARLMLVLNETGRRGEALAAYRRAREIIVGELGVEPGVVLSGAHRAVLQGEPAFSGVPQFC
ncbi:AfsR/SARP family transcriptional regulator [Amycolatopsis sp. QT-25]|uniref:AfsR/SARP family transcriptional regulator n=1 Tax=Amycolatopsis sp. QT-25 TaxID=3034022 RepID=UPI0023EAF68D|nr:AfsR/SARP family transcriptional regulator [Amycolatopsis sp. QT-25]WET82422.1 AfsR/SARP family transcriptional regulator [Amycolatopsis sp. QT-25]